MSFEFNFVADQTIKGRIYPALAEHKARPYTPSWREFGQHHPYTTPLRLQEYCEAHDVKINIFSINESLPNNTWYPICLGFFDFSIDYIELLPIDVKKKIVENNLKILFYYHEGDNPRRIKSRLDSLCATHNMPNNCYVFVSANTAADQLPGFVTFHDFELWYFQRNKELPTPISLEVRSTEFVALSRLHKSWRAVALADLHRNNILTNSFWSYCEVPTQLDLSDSPIEVDMISRLRWDTEKFIQSGPYYSDNYTQLQRNDHSISISKYYTDAYCHIVLESQFDVDQSNGAFITEKTFKPIKHGQMFFIAGAAGSLQTLRNLGYRTFDTVLDNRYDLEHNHTQRWIKLLESIKQAQTQGLHQLYQQCQSDIEHNQKLFAASKRNRLNILHRKIHEQS